MVKFWKRKEKEPPKPKPTVKIRIGLTERLAVYSIGQGWEIGQTMMGSKLIAIKEVEFDLPLDG